MRTYGPESIFQRVEEQLMEYNCKLATRSASQADHAGLEANSASAPRGSCGHDFQPNCNIPEDADAAAD
jgi:hypothetical protein